MASFDELYGQVIRREGIVPFPSAILHFFRAFGLTPQEVWLLLELLAHRWSIQAPYPSIRRLADARGIPRSTLREYLSSLHEKGLLAVVERARGDGGRTSSEFHLDPLFRRLQQLILADEEPPTPGGRPPTPGGRAPTPGGRAAHPGRPGGPGGTTEQAEFPLPAVAPGDGPEYHEDPCEEDSSEVDRNGIFPKKNVDNLSDDADPGPDPLVAAVGQVLDRLGQPRVPARRVQLRHRLMAFAADRDRAVADVAHRARNAAGSLRPGDPESLFWSTLDLLAPRREKGDEDH